MGHQQVRDVSEIEAELALERNLYEVLCSLVRFQM
jgi:hypothetical protein